MEPKLKIMWWFEFLTLTVEQRTLQHAVKLDDLPEEEALALVESSCKIGEKSCHWWWNEAVPILLKDSPEQVEAFCEALDELKTYLRETYLKGELPESGNGPVC